MYLVLMVFAVLLIVGLITMPLSAKAGPGRMAMFLVLSIIGVAAALVVDHELLADEEGHGDSAVESVDGAAAVAAMTAQIEAETQYKVTQAPSIEALENSDVPAVWQFEEGMTLLCSATDFPASVELVCWSPDGVIGQGIATEDVDPDAPVIPLAPETPQAPQGSTEGQS